MTQEILLEKPPAPERVAPEAELEAIARGGPFGAVTLCGIAVTIVVAIWFAFYFLVFLPRGFTR